MTSSLCSDSTDFFKERKEGKIRKLRWKDRARINCDYNKFR